MKLKEVNKPLTNALEANNLNRFYRIKSDYSMINNLALSNIEHLNKNKQQNNQIISKINENI